MRIAAACLILLFASPIVAEDMVTFVTGTEVEIVPDADRQHIEILIEVSDIVVQLEDPVVESVSRGKQSLVALRSAFVPKIENKSRLEMLLKAKPAITPGSYVVAILFRGTIKDTDGKTSEKIERKSITVIVPAAAVRGLGTYVVHRVLYFPGTTTNTGSELILQETSRKSRLTDLVVEQLFVEGSSAAAADARLTFASTNTVRPGGVTRVQATPVAFPLGSVTGKAQVSANELERPVELTFQVKTRVWQFWLLFTLFVGLFVGFVLREKIEKTIAVSDCRVRALDLLRRIQEAYDRQDDQKFHQALEFRNGFDSQVKTATSTEVLEGQITEAQSAFNEALKELKSRRDATEKEISKVIEKLARTAPLPDRVEEERKSALETAEALLDEMESGDVSNAQRNAENLDAGLSGRLIESARSWRDDVVRNLDALGILPQEVEALRNDAQSAADQLDDGNPEPRAFFDKIGGLRRLLRDLISAYDRWLRATQREIGDVLGHEPMQPVVAVLEQLEKKIRAADSAEMALAQLHLGATEVHQKLSDVIRSAADDPAALESQLNEREYIAAAQAAAAKPATRRLGGTPTQVGPVPPAVATVGLRPLFTSEPGSGATHVIIRRSAAMEDSISIPARRAAAEAALGKAKLWRFIVSLLLIGGLGFLMFTENFVGTPTDFAKAFSWAFGVDIGVETVIALSKKMQS